MAKMKLKSSSADDPIQPLQRLFDALQIIHRYEPRITLTGCRLLIFVALETRDRSSMLIPRLRDVTRRLDLSPSGASRLLETLTVKGRKGRAPAEGGFGLIQTDDDIEGRRTNGYVLTEKGRKCVEEVRDAIAGRPCGRFEPHDGDSLFKLLVAEWPQSSDKKGKA